MDQRGVFFEEWLRSLREQYKYVLRNNDQVTLPTLLAVMQNVGFGEEELAQLRVAAVEDVGAGFAPDRDALTGGAADQADDARPQSVTGDERGLDEAGQPAAHDSEPAAPAAGGTFPVAKLDDEATAEDPEPLTFEDSLMAEAEEIEDELAEAEEASDAEGEEADGPQQMSLF